MVKAYELSDNFKAFLLDTEDKPLFVAGITGEEQLSGSTWKSCTETKKELHPLASTFIWGFSNDGYDFWESLRDRQTEILKQLVGEKRGQSGLK